MTHYYFAYGSNMNSERMLARQVPFSDSQPGVLSDFQFVFNKRSEAHGAGHANVVYSPGNSVEGVLYRIENARDLVKLDHFESTPRSYSREIMLIASAQTQIPAWVYIGNPAVLAQGLKPQRWYLNHLLAGRQHLSPNYLDWLSQITCLACDQPDRPIHL